MEERIRPLQKKKWPFDFGFGLPWAASGFGTDLVSVLSVAASAERGDRPPPSPLVVDVS